MQPKKIIITMLIVLPIVISAYAGDITSRSIKLTYTFIITDIPEDAKEIRYWVPLPNQSRYQSITKVDIKNMPGEYTIKKDAKYKNKILCGAYKNRGVSTIKGTVVFDITRLERSTAEPLDNLEPEQDLHSGDLDLYLRPGRLVTLSSRIKKLASKITEGKNNPLDKAWAIYDYVFENMEYSKSTPGWGLGDTERACDIMQGNCTDFHSLFISLARASGIPAKFVIGFSLPDKKKDVLEGYHCWAEFYINGKGWIPVDISNAWKEKSKKEYYFGNLDQNRIQFTTGRDIILPHTQGSKPLNYFIYPYFTADGQGALRGDTLITYSIL
jgi:transglutaminase-like putative cysteine protease